MKTKLPLSFRFMIARVMLIGVWAAIIMMLTGLIILFTHPHQSIPINPYHFAGAPRILKSPIAMFHAALHGNIFSFIQLGLLLLLINPIIRIAMAALGFWHEKNSLYVVLSLIVLAILLISFFW